MSVQNLRYLEGSSVRAWLPEHSSRLRIEIEGDRTILLALVRRCFPHSEAERFLSIQDATGKEVGVLKDLAEVDPLTLDLIRKELDRRYFTPKIVKIHELKQDAGMWYFKADTQRGPTSFYVRNWRDSAHEIHPGRWHINTVDGQRFEIVDVEGLDLESRLLLEQLG